MEEFLFLTHDNTDPYFNIASEEYLLKQKDGFFVYLWKNSPAVIVGINQNTLEEVNLAYAKANNIKVVRRQTGGGAVYHDLNNVCYTIIASYNQEENAYKKFTAPVIEYLNSLGVKAEFSGRNDITVNGKKISGNAQTVYKNRIMHHGTLLFSSDLNTLSSVLKKNKLKTTSKGIKSIRARVTNISEHLPNKMGIDEFFNGLCARFKKFRKTYEFSAEDVKSIDELVKNKYSTYEWNIGYSPKGQNLFEYKFKFGIFKLSFDLNRGKIENALIYGDFFGIKDIKTLSEKLNGINFERNAFINAIKDICDYISGADAKEIADALFLEKNK